MTNHLSIPTDTEESSASNALTGSSSNSPGLISYFVNVISGARQTASQEFGRFWENLEHHHHNIPTTTTTTTTPTSTSTATDSAATTRSIRTPRSSVKNINDTSRLNKGEHINGRIIPDHYRRGYIKDAEIQTENFEVSIPSSTVHKRKASGSLSSNYTYWTELERPLKKQARSVSPPAPSIKEKESSTIGSLPENKDDSSLSPGTREVPWTYSLSANTSPIHRRYFQTRPATASPERRKETTDVMTGSKSVRRLTHELESNFIPRSPMSPYLRAMASPRQQQDKSADREPTKMDLSNDSPNDTTSSSTTRMEDIFPMIKPQPSNESPIKQQQRLTAKELDERMEKLEKEVGITKTKVSQFITPTSSSFTPLNIITSPVKSSSSPGEEPRTYDSPSPLTSKTRSSNSMASPPPPAPPPPLPAPVLTASTPLRSMTSNNAPFSYTASSPIRSSVKESVRETGMAKKKTNEFKPTNMHKEKMQVLIQMIPDVKLRKTNIIIGADGVARPNPYWHEIYRR